MGSIEVQIPLESVGAWPDGMVLGSELTRMRAAWQPRRGSRLQVRLPLR